MLSNLEFCTQPNYQKLHRQNKNNCRHAESQEGIPYVTSPGKGKDIKTHKFQHRKEVKDISRKVVKKGPRMTLNTDLRGQQLKLVQHQLRDRYIGDAQIHSVVLSTHGQNAQVSLAHILHLLLYCWLAVQMSLFHPHGSTLLYLLQRAGVSQEELRSRIGQFP